MGKKDTIAKWLEALDIFSYEDYLRLTAQWEDFDVRVWYGGQNKIDELRNIAVNYYNSIDFNKKEGQYISINPSLGGQVGLDKYMCLFPKRSLIETDSLMSYIDMTPHEGESYDMPPNDFMKQYFSYQQLVDNEIAYLYPNSDKNEQEGLCSTFNSGVIIPLPNVAEIQHSGNISRIVQKADMFYIAFPWLYNAKIDDYIGIAEKNPREFDHLARTVENLMLTGNGAGEVQESLLKDMKEALVNIQISFENQKDVLKRKGIAATVGIALTCIPCLQPKLFSNIDLSCVKSIIGGASIYSNVDMLNDYFAIQKEGNTDPYWVIWKWKQKTTRRK